LEGKKLLKLARDSLVAYFKDKDAPTHTLTEMRGVFVTLKDPDLRGCIGFPLPVMPLGDAIIEAAIAAANDPRFPPLRESELKGLTIEVSVLTVPVKLDEPSPEKIRVGKDGLIIEYNGRSGLLLPQVAPENHMDAEEFLDAVCYKAGLSPASWRDKRATIKTFQAEVFDE